VCAYKSCRLQRCECVCYAGMRVRPLKVMP
jgi:hypothetical protein